jgi:hypothetical protein
MRASMVVPNVAYGARSTLGLMRKRWRSGRSRSPAATLGMRQCCLSCSTRFLPARRSPASLPPLTVCRQTVAPCLAGHACMPEKGAMDGAYDTRKCHDAIAERGAAAVIPPRRNAKPWKAVTAGAVARNDALRLGHALWRPLSAASFGCACWAMDGADTTAGAASRQRCIV